MKSLKDNTHAVIDLSVVIMVGIAFAALMVIAYIIWTLSDQLLAGEAAGTSINQSVQNVTRGFDNAINLLLVAITIFILAIAISALLMLRGR